MVSVQKPALEVVEEQDVGDSVVARGRGVMEENTYARPEVLSFGLFQEQFGSSHIFIFSALANKSAFKDTLNVTSIKEVLGTGGLGSKTADKDFDDGMKASLSRSHHPREPSHLQRPL